MLKEPRFVELRDDLLIMLINEGFECEYYQNIFHIRDREKRIKLLMNNMKNWPLEFCAKSIKHEISLFDAEETEVADELKWCLRHIENSKIVMDALGVLSWTNLYKMCSVNLLQVVGTLLFAQKVSVLIEFLDLNDIDLESLTCVSGKFLLEAFELGISLNSIRALLSALPKTHCFLANFLSIIEPSKWLDDILLSLKIMSMLSPNENVPALFPLLYEPLSIIEVLIMNTKLDLLGEVLKVVKPLLPIKGTDEGEVCVTCIDELLRRYAGKSLDFRAIPQISHLLTSERIAQLSSSFDISHRGFAVPENVPTKEQWIQNNEVTECMCCKSVSFSMFNRRHHCRRCGRLVCSSCSKKRMIVPNYEDILVRVCIDCYNEGSKGQVSSEDNKSWSNGDVFWLLTNDSEHNRIVREEFSYEFAPSVSLCLSLMKYHTTNEQFSMFMFGQCEILLKLLVPKKENAVEIDYRLIILMIKHLAVAVRIAFEDLSQEILPVDTILRKAAILELLAENNFLHLLPLRGGINLLSVRRVIDKLLEMEEWELAMNVSAKASFDNTGIFLTWGKSCLKAGCLMTAREKISKCISRNPQDFTYVELPTTQLKVTKNSPLLSDIIHILESKTEPIDEEVANTHKLSGSTTTLNQSCSASIFQPEDKNDAGDIFIYVYMECLKEGSVGELHSEMSKIDSSLMMWQTFLRKLCYYLEKQMYMNSLYQLQQYMGDYIRAAMTCIRFYQQNVITFSDLSANTHFLRNSERHLKEALEQEQWVDVSTVEVNESRMSFEEKSISNPLLIKKMTHQEIRKNAQIIKLQIEVAQFLANCENRGVVPTEILESILNNFPEQSSEEKQKVPTLFGSSYEKTQLGFLCIVCGETVPEGLPLTLRIISDCNLKPTKVYNEVGKYLAQGEKFGSITELVSQIQKSCASDDNLANEICDEMLLHVVATFSKNVKISAYIETKQLKTAFFLATKHKRLMDIRRIMKEAEIQNLSSIRILCQKALIKHANTNTSPTESDTN
ncbi:hypothetical protein GWI33_001491 [Rhynchophorus ferrugineus]|uniref:FYVE-type domain-containing protein n=1 Tax=Rhynchophorus ferrugineus TaxID=354439 RepID=A0A834ILR8_RHYFE|nr:hypothetical protein GWI33_001491 [Rhynchophorus ferrugineus]